MSKTKVSIALLLFAAAVAGVPVAQAACSNATLNGVYGALSTGLNGSHQPASSVDRVVTDGAGNLSGSSTKSINGQIVTFTFKGTYHISGNCTGTATFNNQDGSIKHANIYLDEGNNGAFLVQTDNRHTESSVMFAQGAANCTDSGVKHKYAFRLTGPVSGLFSVEGGQLTMDGTGKITGVATISQYGTITKSAPVTGTYQINSDCSGSAQITPKGLSAMNWYLLVIDADKEIMAIETDTGTVVAGELRE